MLPSFKKISKLSVKKIKTKQTIKMHWKYKRLIVELSKVKHQLRLKYLPPLFKNFHQNKIFSENERIKNKTNNKNAVEV